MLESHCETDISAATSAPTSGTAVGTEMTPEQRARANSLIHRLHDFVNGTEYGLPIHEEGKMALMREIIEDWMAGGTEGDPNCLNDGVPCVSDGAGGCSGCTRQVIAEGVLSAFSPQGQLKFHAPNDPNNWTPLEQKLDEAERMCAYARDYIVKNAPIDDKTCQPLVRQLSAIANGVYSEGVTPSSES